MPRCRSCNTEVLFVLSAKTGKRMILNAQPEKRVVLVVGDGAHASQLFTATDLLLESTRARVVDVFTDHHATCSHADQWRRGR